MKTATQLRVESSMFWQGDVVHEVGWTRAEILRYRDLENIDIKQTVRFGHDVGYAALQLTGSGELEDYFSNRYAQFVRDVGGEAGAQFLLTAMAPRGL